MQVSFYGNTFSKDIENVNPADVARCILTGEWAGIVGALRQMEPEEYKERKKMLPAVTWSGTFKEGTRLITSVQTYSGLIVLDIDKIDTEKVVLLKRQLSQDPHVQYVFTSPSGNGIKAVFLTDITDPANHRAGFLHLQEYFENSYFQKVDPSGKDVCRLCFVSYDPEMIIKQATPFEVNAEKYNIIVTGHVHTSAAEHEATGEIMAVFNTCVKWVERNKEYVDGQKNVYIHALACAMNRCGATVEDTIRLISQHYTTPDDKWHQSVRSAFFHNQNEHNTVRVKDVPGSEAYIAPPYIANYTDDVAANDIMRITAMLFNYKLTNNEIMDVVGKIGNFYDKMGYIDYRRASLYDMMNYAVDTLKNNIAIGASKDSLAYEGVDSMVKDLMEHDMTRGIPTYIPTIDNATGGLIQGNFYGLIGFGETFKSIFSQHVTYNNAMNDIPTLVLNGEMAKIQLIERLAAQALGINFRIEVSKGNITKENYVDFVKHINNKTKNNIFIFNGTGFDKKSILATIDHIYATTGKKIKMVVMDGLSQMNQMGKDEAAANIYNSGVCKDAAKEANGGEGVVMLSLIHCSGSENKLIRNTGTIVRGGSKMLANMDGYFSTSLFIDQENINRDNPDDINFMQGKFCLRFADKRGGSGVHYAVVRLMERLDLYDEQIDYRVYEKKTQ